MRQFRVGQVWHAKSNSLGFEGNVEIIGVHDINRYFYPIECFVPTTCQSAGSPPLNKSIPSCKKQQFNCRLLKITEFIYLVASASID